MGVYSWLQGQVVQISIILQGRHLFMEKQFKRFGFLDVQVIDNGTRMICAFYENRDGTDKDKFTITKSKLSSITAPSV